MGRSTVKMQPVPSPSEKTRMFPLCRSTRLLAMNNPKPEPPVNVVTRRGKCQGSYEGNIWTEGYRYKTNTTEVNRRREKVSGWATYEQRGIAITRAHQWMNLMNRTEKKYNYSGRNYLQLATSPDWTGWFRWRVVLDFLQRGPHHSRWLRCVSTQPCVALVVGEKSEEQSHSIVEMVVALMQRSCSTFDVRAKTAFLCQRWRVGMGQTPHVAWPHHLGTRTWWHWRLGCVTRDWSCSCPEWWYRSLSEVSTGLPCHCHCLSL